MPIVEVKWLDSNSFNGWNRPSDIKEGMQEKDHLHGKTCGYLFYEDDFQIVIVPSQSQAGNVADAICIPQACVVERKVLKKLKKK